MLEKSKWLPRWIVAVLVIGLLCTSEAWTKRPNTPSSNGGGVIYFSYQGDLYTMNDDGSNIAPVAGFPAAFGPWGEPSRQLHAGKRWFAQITGVPDEFYPEFHPDGTRKDFANRQVLVALSDAGNVVELTIAADLEPLEEPKWGIHDDLLSWTGRRWDIDPESPNYGNVLEGGLYVTELAFDGAGNITGIAKPSLLLVPLPLVPSNASRHTSDRTPGPDMRGHDWAPDGMQFVFDAVSSEELRIGDVVTGAFHVIFADPDGRMNYPRWSPAGGKIMFNYHTGRNQPTFINPDGSGLKKLVGSSPNWTRTVGVWSPTGSHLLYQHWDHFFQDSHILRATSSGSGKTRITDKSLGGGFSTPRAIGWR